MTRRSGDEVRITPRRKSDIHIGKTHGKLSSLVPARDTLLTPLSSKEAWRIRMSMVKSEEEWLR